MTADAEITRQEMEKIVLSGFVATIRDELFW